MASKVSELKSYFKFPLLQEKQRSVRVSDMQHQVGELHEELKSAKEERQHALEELAELKKMNVDFKGTIRPIELQDTKEKDTERKNLDLMFFRTKQLEQSKISFDGIKNFKEHFRRMERSARTSSKSDSKRNGAFDSVLTQEDMRKLRNELRLASEAEDNSQKAMNDFAIALNEVSAGAHQAKSQLSVTRAELEKATEETQNSKFVLQTTGQKLMDTLNDYDKMKLEYEECISVSKAKEDSFLSCMRNSEEDTAKLKQENSRLNEICKIAKEDNTKLRQIMKEAVNEAIALKEALEIVRGENSQMNDQLFEKENSLQQMQQDYESLQVSKAAALESIREMNTLLASASVADSMKNPKNSDFGSFKLPKSTNHDAKARKSMSIFSSQRWKVDKNPTLNRRRHSVGEPGMFDGESFDREKSIESSSIMFSSLRKASDDRVPSSSFRVEKGTVDTDRTDHSEGTQHNNIVEMNLKKKKTVFGRIGDAIRRASFHK
ncbi:polyamine-modulated factor 1-binding protein 1-like [Phalaenopsis equestris]|uniref:polyamine-modulated factor 1-binding protein 1-like n=1 Tax=Phalaenopsis equestris TaxID=78828 RepID=UPI0009E484AA|nr:polyamine-modulated factor 1-binding protein 1-like [Phalaenopsis equestris]XP_020595960.1 polyamine-modulated factor 1-binding protein 1-like [Phalaenopsis equestris]